jgi:hypothetical protein
MQKRIIYLSLVLVGILGCKKKTHDLPSPEAAVIKVTNLDGNSFTFQNATPTGGSGTLWDFGELGTSTLNTVTVFFPFKGTFDVKLTSNSKGGITSTSTTITVEQTAFDYAADFSVEKIDENHFKVSVTTPFGLKQKFTYSGSTVLSDTNVVDTVYFPFAGDYNISAFVTAFKDKNPSAKPVTSTKNRIVSVASDDASNADLNNYIYNVLTGGISDLDGRTWIISPAAHLSGTGPWKKTRYDLGYYDYPDGLTDTPAWALGALSNEFTFIMRGYQFIPKNSNATANWYIGNLKLGMTNAQYADKEFVDPNIAPGTFKLTKGAFLVDTTKLLGYGLDFNNKAYLGFFQNRLGYEICKISGTKDSVWVRQKYNDNEDVYKSNPVEFEDPSKDPNARTLLLVEKK